jgi:soluble lytic murein transglycosylase-like protein
MAFKTIGLAAIFLLGTLGLAGNPAPVQAKTVNVESSGSSTHALKSRHHRKHAKRHGRGAPSASIIASVKAHARAAGVPVGVALAVVRHESSFNPRARGRAGEIGLMQLKCQTARGMGYRGGCGGLYNVSTNLRYGMRYLRMALNRGGVGYYNAGIGAKRLPKAAKRYALQVRKKIRRN